MRTGILEKYASFLPVSEQTPKLTLYEGETPLIFAEQLSDELGVELYLKWEGANPTGSFKDRGMVVAVAKAVEEGSRAIMCASTGNTSASAAAYAARLGLRCLVVIPHNYVAMGKLSQAIMYGAEILALEGNFDQALAMVRQVAAEQPITLVNSVNPYRIEGQKTAAFEVSDQLGQVPDILALPVGNAGNITAYWKGFVEYHEHGYTSTLPKMWGFEAEGAAAIVQGKPIEKPETVATAIRIGNPASWETAVQARDQSNGLIDSVTDQEILAAYQKLAKSEGVFAEPGSCASIAGVIKKKAQGELVAGQKVVCVLTGNGLKDPQTAIQHTNFQPKVVPFDYQALVSAMLPEKDAVL
ncbi:threonine synthase [Seinonella peptonophila]|uniref:Threonine synthase n=1 Tax=Seinonella peptonophila TaxID=112248 RepID=A0A1M4TSW2_9BACL|nr:threonine synthase [Seinonella peptonophila]SHE47485.1 threonine synthase [Seinonella peptonophila]